MHTILSTFFKLLTNRTEFLPLGLSTLVLVLVWLDQHSYPQETQHLQSICYTNESPHT